MIPLQELNIDLLLSESERLLDWIATGGAASRFIYQKDSTSNELDKFLHSFEQLGQTKNFVISRIKLSDKNQFHKFEVIYSLLTSNLSPNNFLQHWMSSVSEEEKNNLAQNISVTNLAFGYAFYHFINGMANTDNEIITASWNYMCGQKVAATSKRKLSLVGSVTKENVEAFFLCMNRLIRSTKRSGWIIIFESIENIALGRTEIIRNEAYNNIRQLLDLQGANQLKNNIIFFCSNNASFIQQSIHDYKALAERIYPESDLYQKYQDSRNIIWTM